MKTFYLFYGSVLCILLAYSNYHGMTFGDLVTGKWNPKGRQAYHK